MANCCMKVISIPDEMLGDSRYTTIQREDHPFIDIKVLETTSPDGEKRHSVMIEVESEDLVNIIENAGHVWLTFFSEKIPEFMAFTTEV